MKLWGGRFRKELDKLAAEFTASISFDKRLWHYDIEGSIAHAKMLGKCGIISKKEAKEIVQGLQTIKKEFSKDESKIDLSCEDIHTAIEKRLAELIGETAGKLHTARSRNDQIALDIRMYLKDKIKDIVRAVTELQKTLIDLSEKNIDLIMPGYTHLQPAQPVLVSHHLMAYYYMLERDYERLQDCYKHTDIMPLGSAALAGTSFPIDREYAAKLLGFSKISENSLDAVSDRDFVLEFLSAASLIMMHLSRLCEELVLWSTPQFGFVELDEAFCTGSSIMPQKRNPDVPELIRGKTGKVYGNLMALLTVLKALPLAYNRDMQEDKIALFETVDILETSLRVLARMLKGTKFIKENLLKSLEQDFLTATDLADYLTKKGIPFRKAHQIVGKIVLYCQRNKKQFTDLTSTEFKSFSHLFSEDIKEILTPQASIESKKSFGGTAKPQVLQAIRKAKTSINQKTSK